MVINMKGEIQKTNLDIIREVGDKISSYKKDRNEEYKSLLTNITTGLFVELERRFADHLSKNGTMPYKTTIEMPNGYDHIFQNTLCFEPEFSGINTKEIFEEYQTMFNEMGFRLEIIPNLRGIQVTVR